MDINTSRNDEYIYLVYMVVSRFAQPFRLEITPMRSNATRDYACVQHLRQSALRPEHLIEDFMQVCTFRVH